MSAYNHPVDRADKTGREIGKCLSDLLTSVRNGVVQNVLELH